MTAELINRIEFSNYKKFKTTIVNLSNGINVIMGNNGTGKTTLMHVISNTYKSIAVKDPSIGDEDLIKQIRNVNHNVNPKMERLYRVSQHFSENPVKDTGVLFTCTFNSDRLLNFRRHDSGDKDRLRIIPKYQNKGEDTLPSGLVLYLGLSRLHSFGEYIEPNVKVLKGKNNSLPKHILEKIEEKYKEISNLKIINPQLEKMGTIKNRTSFKTENNNIDSNTISAGQDNLLIILTAIFSLDYFLSIEDNPYPGILLIDELENSLHPDFQIKVVSLLIEICERHSNLQIVFTTHSFEILDFSVKNKLNLIYLLDSVDDVDLLPSPDAQSVRGIMTKNEDKIIKHSIPYLTEDPEAADFLHALFNYLKDTKPELSDFFSQLSHVESSFSSESLKQIFNKSQIPLTTFSGLGFLDGDQTYSKQLQNLLLVLPGKNSPEQIAFSTMKECMSQKNTNQYVKNFLYQIAEEFYCEGADIQSLIDKYEAILEEIERMKADDKPTKGLLRSRLKDLYKSNTVIKEFFKIWPYLDENEKDLIDFEKNLRIAFRKLGPIHSIKKSYWLSL